jgi:uncharacterized membrane protein YhiD involved in acid resistance
MTAVTTGVSFLTAGVILASSKFDSCMLIDGSNKTCHGAINTVVFRLP